ncbi:cytochrome c3 family protein [Thiovibrio sp. JS02]
MRVRFFSVAVCIFLLACSLFVPAPEASAKGCLNGACHERLAGVRYLHGPVAAEMAGANGCEMCHLPAGPACSANKGGKFTLKSKDICLTCHARGTGTQHTQAQVESKCLTCHAPHGSDTSPQMLRPKKR